MLSLENLWAYSRCVDRMLTIVEQLVTHKILTIEDALNSYSKMEQAGRRLPWKLAKQQLERFK